MWCVVNSNKHQPDASADVDWVNVNGNIPNEQVLKVW